MVVYIVASLCVFTDLNSVLYVKIFSEKIEDIWVPLLIAIALLESGAAIFFFQETRVFRSDSRSYLHTTMHIFEARPTSHSSMACSCMCSAFLVLSVIGSLSCALPSFRHTR